MYCFDEYLPAVKKMPDNPARNLIFLLLVCGFWTLESFSQGTWTPKTSLSGTSRTFAAGFSIGTKGYIATGANATGTTVYKDLWEWDQVTGFWTQQTSLPPAASARAFAVGFSIGTKGYIGTGVDFGGGSTFKDFWEWDQATNTWIARAILPAAAQAR